MSVFSIFDACLIGNDYGSLVYLFFRCIHSKNGSHSDHKSFHASLVGDVHTFGLGLSLSAENKVTL
jgi:hypothetical protein